MSWSFSREEATILHLIINKRKMFDIGFRFEQTVGQYLACSYETKSKSELRKNANQTHC